MSPIYAYGYENSLHKLLLQSCGIFGVARVDGTNQKNKTSRPKCIGRLM